MCFWWLWCLTFIHQNVILQLSLCIWIMWLAVVSSKSPLRHMNGKIECTMQCLWCWGGTGCDMTYLARPLLEHETAVMAVMLSFGYIRHVSMQLVAHHRCNFRLICSLIEVRKIRHHLICNQLCCQADSEFCFVP